VLRRVSITCIVAAGLGASLIAGCGDGGSKTFRALTGRPHLTVLDLGPRGKSGGDLYVYDNSLLDAHGHVIGRVRGMSVSIKLEHGAETAQGMLTYEFGPGNSIVVGGLSQRSLRGQFTLVNRRFVRPVLGGTGKYAGASGVVVVKRRPDGRYESEFRLQD
jgi:hypothetical protein